MQERAGNDVGSPTSKSNTTVRKARQLMEEQAASRRMPRDAKTTSSPWGEAGLLLVLLTLAGVLHTWLVWNTEVPARDGIGFIRYAWQLENQPWPKVIHDAAQHPLYPASVLAISWPVRSLLQGPTPELMALSAQLVSALAGVLLVIPMFYLGKALFDQRVGFWAALLFQCLPVGARVTSDALSEGLFLLLTVIALLAAVHALRGPSIILYLLCGVFSGLAYLTRPEGAFTLVAVGLVLWGMQAVASTRQGWFKVLGGTVGLALGGLLIAGPYVAITGRISSKFTAQSVLGIAESRRPDGAGPEATAPHDPPTQTRAVLSPGGQAIVGRPLAASMLALWWEGKKEDLLHRLGWSVWAVGTEMVKGYHYIACVAVLLGLYWCRPRLIPGAWVLMLVCIMQAVVVCRVALVMGYASDRHVLVLVLCGLFWGVAALFELPQRLLAWRASLAAQPGMNRSRPGPQGSVGATAWSVVLLLGLAASGLPKMMPALHANRAGHRLAGEWLAEHAKPIDALEDPFYWAYYYAGWVFWENLTPLVPADHQRAHYVVVEHSTKPHSRLSKVPQEVVAQGVLVYHCPLQPDQGNDEEVQVYKLPWDGKTYLPPPQPNVP
jgi:hypothetical protein